MLYEAFYPSELSDNHPHKIYYGFVQEGSEVNYQITLVVFYPKLMGTSLFNLSDEVKTGLANFLLNKHVYAVGSSFVKVAFVCPHISEDQFYGECWSVDVFDNFVAEEVAKFNFLQKLFPPKTIQVMSRYLTIGRTKDIQLVNMVNIDFDRTKFLLNELKRDDFGDFASIFGGNS
ncbi:hypothetical protein [Acinetobacter calcoaceticus]|uniref:hypothetical protein n=1 Tax=Acinetobacter calcoaceticus TaxID=471 RepID=UPI00124D0A77|nr:hypothetical protein [Acinetobacter calcoaceticus]